MDFSRRLLPCVALACGSVWAQAPANPAPPVTVTLQQALTAARDNADVRMATRALEASRADVLSADHAPLPVLSAKASSIDLQNGIGGGNVLTRKRIDKGIGLDWTWERGDKRELRRRAADQAVRAAGADVDDTRSQQLVATQEAFWALLAAQQKLAEVRAIREAAQQSADVAERRQRAGDLSAQEALRTRIEAERAASDEQAARLERQRAALLLTQLTRLGGPASDALQAEADWPALTEPTALPEAVADALVDSRPEVRAAQARVDTAQAALEGAQALRKTDVTVGASFDHYPGTSTRLLELRVQIPLQWGYAYQGEIGRAQAQLDQAREFLDKTRAETRADLQRLAFEARTAAERARRYEQDILPRARQASQGAQLAYDKGALSLTDLLDARRTLRGTLLEAIDARADHARATSAWQLRTAEASAP
jgi:cobalt-zinc-cadmium efflux system outer membrane protein